MTEKNADAPDAKEGVCPDCGSVNSIPVAYGLPDNETSRQAELGEVALGGCTIWENMPDRECRECKKRFRSDPAAQKKYDDETARQLSRIEAQKRGDYMLFNPRTQSMRDIVDALNAKAAEQLARKQRTEEDSVAEID